MLRASYSDEEKSLFHQLRYSYPDERVMRRFEILWLHACGKFAPEIAFIVQQNDDTVRKVIKDFKKSDYLRKYPRFHQPTLHIHPMS